MVGELITFEEFIKTHQIEIPRIQRDYTYGAGTEKTEKVVDKLLSDIYSAIADDSRDDGQPLILDFVYGCDNQEKMFEPLDGQQRLTTLFLLHIYAAWKAGADTSGIQFRYATRNNTSDFCMAITSHASFKYSKDAGRPSEQITDCPFFLPSFKDDPSICSMLVVLDKIDVKFHVLAELESDNLWYRLNNSCRVKFYCLDFGKFSRSHELYVKMNSRGKALTEYEIFKSQLEKYIEVSLGDKDLMYRFSTKFDTDYTDLIWSEMGRDKSKIDSGFVFLFRNLLSILHFKRGNTAKMASQKYVWDYLPDEHDASKSTGIWEIDRSDIDFILDFMDVFNSVCEVKGISPSAQKSPNDMIWELVFYAGNDICEPETDSSKMRIRLFNKEVNLFRSACTSQLTYSEMIMLYACYLAFKRTPLLSAENPEAVNGWREALNPLRHIRNLVDNSVDELSRPEYIHELMSETELIIDGRISGIAKTRFNTTQMSEEKQKEKHPELWKELYRYENHDILRGALSIFSLNSDGDNSFDFDIDRQDKYDKICERLRKFEHIFDNGSKANDRLIRASLLSITDFGRVSISDRKHNYDNRMIGHGYGSWRLLFTVSNDYIQTGIIEAIDKFPEGGKVEVLELRKDDWRYYATHEDYREYYYDVPYSPPAYGYLNHKNPKSPLEVYVMQSSQSHDDNIMYKLLTRILWKIRTSNGKKFISSKRSRIGSNAPDSGIHSDNLKIDVTQRGWRIEDGGGDLLDKLRPFGYNIADDVVIVPEDTDYIQYGLKLVDDIEKILNAYTPAVDNNPAGEEQS